MNNTKPILSISILVSNRIDTVEKTMESVKRIMDRIPCELIIVDTVGEEKSDGSLAIAKKYATKLVHFDWINDFAAARNAGLKLATGEWFMFMDDDEEFIDIEDLVDFFKSGKQKKYNTASYKLHDYSYDGSYSVVDMQRMIRRIPQTQFVGKIHEALDPAFLPLKELKSYADHHGYAFASEEERLKKFERNYPILCEEFEKDKRSIRTRLQMIQEITSLRGYEAKTDELIEDTLFNEHDYTEKDLTSSFYQWIIATYVRHAKRWYTPEIITERVDVLREKKKLTELTRLSLACMDAIASIELNKAERIKKDIDEITQNYDYLKSYHQVFYTQNILDQGLFMEKEYVLDRVTDALMVYRDHGCTDKELEDGIKWIEKLIKDDDLEFEFRFKTGRKIGIHDNIRGLNFIKETLLTFKEKKENDYYKQLITDVFKLHESAGTQVEETISDYEYYKNNCQFTEELECAVDAQMTRICIINNRLDLAIPFVDNYLTAYETLAKQSEKFEAVKNGDLSSGISESTHNEMLYFGCYTYLNCGEVMRAWICIGEMPWTSSQFKEWEGALRLAFALNRQNEQPEIIVNIVRSIMSNPSASGRFAEMLKYEDGIKAGIDGVLKKITDKK